MAYKIFYKDIKIGFLEINDDGQYRYTPEFKGVQKVKDEAALIPEMVEKSGWRSPIPFFKNRIENAARFNREQEIDSHTDFFRMIKEER